MRDMEKLIAEYRCGATLAELAHGENISRERVRQLLRREGVLRQHGGAAVRAQRQRELRKQKTMERLIAHWGPIGATLPPTVRRAYSMDRRNAHQRGIAWELTLENWWMLWRDDFTHRGQRRGRLWLCRINPAHGYSVDNLEIREAGKRRGGEKWQSTNIEGTP